MLSKLKELRRLTNAAKQQGVSMQRRLRLYWMSMVLAVFAALILVLSFAGVFSDPAQKLSDALAIQQQNTVAALSEQLSGLTAQCVALSKTLSKEVSNTLIEHGAVFDDLSDNQSLIAEVEEALYGPLHATLRASDCSGVLVLLDATTNTGLERSQESRMGLYLRYSDLNRTGSANQHLTYFRGASEIARRQQVQMHNRWNLEFDTTCLPGYDNFMDTPVDRLADGGIWSERTHLKDTWEDVLLLYVPVLDGDGGVCGLCGVELSELYFRLSYPPIVSNYGGMVTVLAPLNGNELLLDRAMLGDSMGLRLEPKGTLRFKEGTYYNTYSSGTERYIGLHQIPRCALVSGRDLAVVTLLPESSYDKLSASSRTAWIVGSLAFLLCMLTLARYLSRRFVRPITQSIKAIQESPTGKQRSGISEIDELLAFIQSKADQQQIGDELPPNIEAFFSEFTCRVEQLTPMERTVLQYYIDGCEIGEIAQRAFISINTAKKHNTNINRKLGVSTREELTLYIDLFRRCGRLEQITYHI
ncbi:regulatory protein, luxR family [Oscillibacter sp. PC13]|uniref:helix-turn-helix transcriptional regulator n=1 Tax=Oscillibacter sp. PC13 TaxID=1855299 RepID=UPI0008EAF7AE|nr:helix-turn-helix transcriptional regulator [Oscillibacter sp. PC13]SFQ15529.1 regulatory protein, luxR family [Oscillibacter sp. PC13]